MIKVGSVVRLINGVETARVLLLQDSSAVLDAPLDGFMTWHVADLEQPTSSPPDLRGSIQAEQERFGVHYLDRVAAAEGDH